MKRPKGVYQAASIRQQYDAAVRLRYLDNFWTDSQPPSVAHAAFGELERAWQEVAGEDGRMFRIGLRMIAATLESPGGALCRVIRRARVRASYGHLLADILAGHGVLAMERLRGARRLFPPWFLDRTTRLRAVSLQDAGEAHLLEILAARPRDQSTVCDVTKRLGWSRSTTLARLKRLQEVGLARQTGGSERYPMWEVDSAALKGVVQAHADSGAMNLPADNETMPANIYFGPMGRENCR